MWLWFGLALVLLSCSPSERRMRRNLMLAKHRPHPNGAAKIDFDRGFSARIETVFVPFAEKWFRPPTLVRLEELPYIRAVSTAVRNTRRVAPLVKIVDFPDLPIRHVDALLVEDSKKLHLRVHACRVSGEGCERALALLNVTQAPPVDNPRRWHTAAVGIEQQLAALAAEVLEDHTVIHMTAHWTRVDNSYWEFTLTPPNSN